jgi:hypothetical protein
MMQTKHVFGNSGKAGFMYTILAVVVLAVGLVAGCAPALGPVAGTGITGPASAAGPIPAGSGRVTLSLSLPAGTDASVTTITGARGVWNPETVEVTITPVAPTVGTPVTLILLPKGGAFALDLAAGTWKFAAVSFDSQGWESSRGETQAAVTAGNTISVLIDLVESTGDVELKVANLPEGTSQLIATADRPSRWMNRGMTSSGDDSADTRLLNLAAGPWRFRVIASVPNLDGGFDCWVSVARAEVVAGQTVSPSMGSFMKVVDTVGVFVPAGASLDQAAAARYHGTEFDTKWLELRLSSGNFPLDHTVTLHPLVMYSGGWSSASVRGGETNIVLAGTGQERFDSRNTMAKVEHLTIKAAGNFGAFSLGGNAGAVELRDVRIESAGWSDWPQNGRIPYIPIAVDTWGISLHGIRLVADGGINAGYWNQDCVHSLVLRDSELGGPLNVQNMDADISGTSISVAVDPRLSDFPDEYLSGAAAYFRNRRTIISDSHVTVGGKLFRDRFTLNGIQYDGLGSDPVIELTNCFVDYSVASTVDGRETTENHVHVLLLTGNNEAADTFTARVNGGMYTVRELPGGFPTILVVSSALSEEATTVEVQNVKFRYLPPYPRSGNFVFLRRPHWAGPGGGSIDQLENCSFDVRDWGMTSPYVDEVDDSRSAWFQRVTETERAEMQAMLNSTRIAGVTSNNAVILVPFDWNLDASLGLYTRLGIGVPGTLRFNGSPMAVGYFDVTEPGDYSLTWGPTWEGPYILSVVGENGSTLWSGTASRTGLASLAAGRYRVYVRRDDNGTDWQTVSVQVMPTVEQ